MSINSYNFADHLIRVQRNQGSILVCGLDPQPQYIPKFFFHKFRHVKDPFELMARVFVAFNTDIISSTWRFVCGYKPQAAFYERYGHWGWWALEETIKLIKQIGLVSILDVKRNDGGDTAAAYAGLLTDIEMPYFTAGEVLFRNVPGLDVDCMTVNVWIGDAFMIPLLERVKPAGKGLMCVNRTSFKPQSQIENLNIETERHNRPLWQVVAEMVKKWSEGTTGKESYSPIGVVLGATCEEDSDFFRENLPKNIKLIPGYGKQGGGADGAVKSFNKDGFGGVVNSSRAILYAYTGSDFACDEHDFTKAATNEAARSRDELNRALERHTKSSY